MSPPKHLLTFNGLHDVISQKTELFTNNLVDNLTRFKAYKEFNESL
jgi:hypothetical protein